MEQQNQTIQQIIQDGSKKVQQLGVEEEILSYLKEGFTREKLQNIFKKYISYDENISQSKKISPKPKNVSLKQPQLGELKCPLLQTAKQRLIKIMRRAYNREELKLGEFNELNKYFKLSANEMKLISYPDPIILQTLRYAIFNLQQIPDYLIKVINEMAKTNMAKDWEIGCFTGHKAVMFLVLYEQFEPPLDLYLQFVDKGLISPHQQELIQILVRNQFHFKSKFSKKQFYSTVSQKKRLVFNQFPYLLNIFNRINACDSSCFNFQEFKSYMSQIMGLLQFQTEDHLLERYLPEVKCRYLNIKAELSSSDIEYLFVCLKSIQNFNSEDFKILYHTKPIETTVSEPYCVKAWLQFWKIEQLCSKMLTKEDFHLDKKCLQKIVQMINLEKSDPEKIIQTNLIFAMLREQCYRNQQFSKSLIHSMIWQIKNIPDKKKIKQCAYIILRQYFLLLEKNPQKKQDLIIKYTLPSAQLDSILDEGRQLALNIFLNQKQEKLVLNEKKYELYTKNLRDIINDTKNKTIKRKALQLYKKLNKANNFKEKDLIFFEENLLKTNQYIQFILQETKNGTRIGVESINNVMKILLRNNKSQIRKNCLITLRYLIKNHCNNNQHFPQKFEESLIQLLCNVYLAGKLYQQCKHQILKLAIDLTQLIGTYANIDLLMKFFLQVYSKSSPNGTININSSFGIFQLISNFKEKSHHYHSSVRSFLDNFSQKALRTYKNIFQSMSKMSKGNMNILCALVALAENQILLPDEIIQQLTLLASKNKNLTSLCLIAVITQSINSKSKPLSEKSMLNICQIMKQNEKNKQFAAQILEINFQKNSLSGMPDKKQNIYTNIQKQFDKLQRI